METKIYAVRTTIGRERSVADMITARTEKEKFGVKSILVPHDIRGYILVEAINKSEIEKSLHGVSHSRGIVEGEIKFEEIEKFFEPKPMVTKVDVGDIVELVSGPFKGEKARVVRVDLKKEEITVELFEATVPIPVTVSGDSIKVVRKEEKESETGD
jgi:transcriptional antiterminator NusG